MSVLCSLQAMRGELDRQDPVLSRVTDHVEHAQDGLANVQRSAEKTLGKKGVPPSSPFPPFHLYNTTLVNILCIFKA